MKLRFGQAPDLTANTENLFPEVGVIDFLQTFTSPAEGPSHSADSMRSTSSACSQPSVQPETASQWIVEDETALLQYMRAAFLALDSAFRSEDEDEQTHGPHNPEETEDAGVLRATGATNAADASWMSPRPTNANNQTSASVEDVAQSDEAQLLFGGWKPESLLEVRRLYHGVLEGMRDTSTA